MQTEPISKITNEKKDKASASNFPFINILKVLAYATNWDSLVLATLL